MNDGSWCSIQIFDGHITLDNVYWFAFLGQYDQCGGGSQIFRTDFENSVSRSVNTGKTGKKKYDWKDFKIGFNKIFFSVKAADY